MRALVRAVDPRTYVIIQLGVSAPPAPNQSILLTIINGISKWYALY